MIKAICYDKEVIECLFDELNYTMDEESSTTELVGTEAEQNERTEHTVLHKVLFATCSVL